LAAVVRGWSVVRPHSHAALVIANPIDADFGSTQPQGVMARTPTLPYGAPASRSNVSTGAYAPRSQWTESTAMEDVRLGPAVLKSAESRWGAWASAIQLWACTPGLWTRGPPSPFFSSRYQFPCVPLQTFWQAGCEGMIGVW